MKQWIRCAVEWRECDDGEEVEENGNVSSHEASRRCCEDDPCRSAGEVIAECLQGAVPREDLALAHAILALDDRYGVPEHDFDLYVDLCKAASRYIAAMTKRRQEQP